ncbi:hypothetical protein P9112_011838 [Eukaryota sp. TZLM1-RC]
MSSKLSRSSIRTGSTSVGSQNVPNADKTDPPSADNPSSSAQTPQLGTETTSAGEGNISCSILRCQDTPFSVLPVVPINLHFVRSVVPSTPSSEVSGKTRQPPSTSAEVPAKGFRQTIHPAVEALFSEGPAPITNTPAPSPELFVRLPFPVLSQTPLKRQQIFFIPPSERIICAPLAKYLSTAQNPAGIAHSFCKKSTSAQRNILGHFRIPREGVERRFTGDSENVVGDFLLRKTKQPNQLHRLRIGPYLVLETPFNSTLLIKDLTIGEQTKVAKRDCKIYNTDDPNDVDLLRAIAATDSGKHVIEEILDEYNTAQGPFCTVRWFGSDTTEEPLNSIIYSEAYQRFNKKPNKRKRKSIKSNNAARALFLPQQKPYPQRKRKNNCK